MNICKLDIYIKDVLFLKAYNFESVECICTCLCIISQIGMLLPVRIGSVIFKTQM